MPTSHAVKRAFVKYAPGILLFLFAVVTALLTYQDYGMAWDEPEQRHIGQINYDYVFNHGKELLTYVNRDYGAGWELPLIMFEKWMGLESVRDVTLMRHLASHLFFLFGGFAVYLLIFRSYKNQFLACLGFIMLVFDPRIYAHSFVNTKDVPFMAMFPILLLACQYAFSRGRWLPYLLLGIVAGYTTSIRVMGVLPVCFIVTFLLIDIIKASMTRQKAAQVVLWLFLFLAGFCATLYTCFPNLWSAPLSRFVECFTNMAHFKWSDKVLLNGSFVKSADLPRYYFLLWFTISNPPFWLLLGFGGLVMLIVEMLRRPATFIFNTPQRNQLLYVACFVAPVFAVIVMKSVLYDDWRHLYFVLPSFLLIAIYLVHRLHGKMKKVVYAMCMVQVAFVGIDMVTNHPFHQVYFNSLVSHKEEFLRKNYELDYWGCSYKQALDYLIAQDHYGWIKVYSPNKGFACLDNNILMLQQGDQKRIFDVDSVAADYMITNFRWHPADYKVGKLVYSIKVNNSTIMAVYKLK